MICDRCQSEMTGRVCASCGWGGSLQTGSGGQTLRLNPCDVPGCGRIVSAGDPDATLRQGMRLPIRCRFHRDPQYTDPPRPFSLPRCPDPGPCAPFAEIRDEFDRIKAASGRALRAYWQEQGVTVRPVSAIPSGWTSTKTTVAHWADRWFPPIP